MKYARLLILLFLIMPRSSAGDASSDALKELAGKIVAITGPLEEISLTLRGLASFTPAEVTEARRELEAELRGRGVRLTARSEGAVRIDVTLSENLESRLWIADIRRAESRDVVMVVRTLTPATSQRDVAAPLTLQRKLLIEQEDPILDLALMDDEMLVLEMTRVADYRRKEDRWETRNYFPLPDNLVWSRDPRGRLIVEGENFRVYLPGFFCAGTRGPTRSMECQAREVPWPFDSGSAEFIKRRNFFSFKNLPAFFSAAGADGQGNVFWVLTGIDGRALLFDKSLAAIGSFGGWGSDIAGVESACGRGRQVLATLRSDTIETDSVQAFEFANRHATPVSPPLELPGFVRALWPSAAGTEAVAVARNSKTGRHAAFHISVACSR